MNGEKIAAIVVTYNRKELLAQALEGILRQERPVDRIFVVENASTDGTEEAFKQQFAGNERIEYIKLATNTGSAGGFYEGAKHAYEWGADWVWFLDDDVYPTPPCLEMMLRYKDISKCVHPSKRDLHGKEFVWENTYDPSTVRASFFPENFSFKHGKEFTFVSIGCFEGMLIHRDVVSQIGFPDPRFFTASDDVAYGFLASLYTNVIYVRDAYLTKLLPLSGKISPVYMYYAVRNQFLLKEYSERFDAFKPSLFYLYFITFCVYASIKQTLRNGSVKTVWYIWKGFFHGIYGRFGKL